MKIRIGYRLDPLCEGEAHGTSEVHWTGDTSAASSVIDWYAQTGLRGESLLRRLVERLRGQWWAEEIG